MWARQSEPTSQADLLTERLFFSSGVLSLPATGTGLHSAGEILKRGKEIITRARDCLPRLLLSALRTRDLSVMKVSLQRRWGRAGQRSQESQLKTCWQQAAADLASRYRESSGFPGGNQEMKPGPHLSYRPVARQFDIVSTTFTLENNAVE